MFFSGIFAPRQIIKPLLLKTLCLLADVKRNKERNKKGFDYFVLFWKLDILQHSYSNSKTNLILSGCAIKSFTWSFILADHWQSNIKKASRVFTVFSFWFNYSWVFFALNWSFPGDSFHCGMSITHLCF